MLSPLLLVVSSLSIPGAPALENALPLHTPGGWCVDVGPGTVTIGGEQISLADPARLVVPEPGEMVVRNEEHTLPVFNPNAGGWRKGVRLRALVTQECSATGLLHPASVTVKRTSDGTPYTLGKDYAMDGLWATVGRLEEGAIAEGEAVHIDYTYSPARLDGVLLNAAGQVRLAVGTPGLGVELPPVAGPGEHYVGSIWIHGRISGLTDENLFPVDFSVAEAAPPEYYAAEQFLPKTLAKLEAGEKVKIVAWGDSVSAGGGVGGDKDAWYQHQFLDRLKARYPKADISLITAAWPGRGSRNYLEAPAGGEYDFEHDVLGPKPDLVTCEWVNDAYLKDEALVMHYTRILEKLQGAGAEVVLLTPHLVRPDWMGVDTLKFDDDPRPYVQGLRRFAAKRTT